MALLSFNEMVRAMLADDARYDGQFYVCVRSTRIYCLPSCKARRPKPENVLFCATREEAIAAGYRGCKRCRAEFYPDLAPAWLHRVVTRMQERVDGRLRETDLAAGAGVDISTIRRYFKTYLRTTPGVFHRRLRLEHARSLIDGGQDYLTAAYDSGFESASGFREAFRREYGTTPGTHRGHIPGRL